MIRVLCERGWQLMGNPLDANGKQLYPNHLVQMFVRNEDMWEPWGLRHPFMLRGWFQMPVIPAERLQASIQSALYFGGTRLLTIFPEEFFNKKDSVAEWKTDYVTRVYTELERFFNHIGITLTDEQKNIIKECCKGRQSQFYKVYKIKKKSGGFRVIEAPCDALKHLQSALLHHLLVPVWASHSWAFGFVPHRSIVQCASHINRARCNQARRALLKIDLKDFFPSITEGKVLGALLKQWGRRCSMSPNWCWYPDLIEKSGVKAINIRRLPRYRRHIKCRNLIKRGDITFSPLMTECSHKYEIVSVAVLRFLHLIFGMSALACIDGRLPQGSPLSPYLSNIVMYQHDCVIRGMRQRGARYADDICFVGDDVSALYKTYKRLERRFTNHGLVVNPKKVHILRHGKPMRVVGLNINSGRVTVSRYKRKNVEAMMHNIITGKHEKARSTLDKISGYRALFKMANQWTPKYEDMYTKIMA